MDRITHHDKTLAHLYKYRHIRPDIQFGAPVEITQDGIASCIGITRSHASVVIRIMIDKGEVMTGLATIKNSRSPIKRKIYFLTEYGKRCLKDRMDYLEQCGIDLLDMDLAAISSSLDEIKRNLGDRMDDLGSLCVLRIPAMRDEISFTCPLIHSRNNGESYVSEFARNTILSSCTEEDMVKWHSKAADWCLDHDKGTFERIYHLGRSRRDREAIRIIMKNRFYIMDNADPAIAAVIYEIAGRNPDSELSLISARMSVEFHDTERASCMIGPLCTSDPAKGQPLMCEMLLEQDRLEDAMDLAVSNGEEDMDSGIALAMCLMASERFEEAKGCLERTRRRMLSSGCLFRMDRLLRCEAENELHLGNTQAARTLIRSASFISKNARLKDDLSAMEQSIGL